MKLFGLYAPNGKLRDVCLSANDAWTVCFHLQSNTFRSKYWKKLIPARNAAKELGWKVIEGSFVPNGEIVNSA